MLLSCYILQHKRARALVIILILLQQTTASLLGVATIFFHRINLSNSLSVLPHVLYQFKIINGLKKHDVFDIK